MLLLLFINLKPLISRQRLVLLDLLQPVVESFPKLFLLLSLFILSDIGVVLLGTMAEHSISLVIDAARVIL